MLSLQNQCNIIMITIEQGRFIDATLNHVYNINVYIYIIVTIKNSSYNYQCTRHYHNVVCPIFCYNFSSTVLDLETT